ncbi:MAG: helical membrane plugin domain-containing protein [Acidithiobacillus ferrivorans]
MATVISEHHTHDAELRRAQEALAELVNNGDLDRLVQLARLIGSAQDAMSDEMISRMAGMAGDALCLVDRITRAGTAEHLLGVVEQIEKTHVMTDLLQSLAGAAAEAAHAPTPKGGVGGLWEIIKQPETQQTIQFLILVGKHFRARQRAHPAEA